jgi:hypothetical protein
VTGDEFFELYCDAELRTFIWDESKRRSRNEHVQEEYRQEAWLLVSLAPADKTLEYYKEVVSFAIHNARWTEYKNNRIHRYFSSHSIEVELALREQQGREDAFDWIESHFRDAGVVLKRSST